MKLDPQDWKDLRYHKPFPYWAEVVVCAFILILGALSWYLGRDQ
jgi:hypothetical protein